MKTARTLHRLNCLLLMVTLGGAGAPTLALEKDADALPTACVVSETPHAVQNRAEQGDPVAQFQLAKEHLATLGCLISQDASVGFNHAYQRARYWYQEAATQGYGPAQVALGQLERTFGGDPHTALTWFHKAATQGCLDAYYALGQMYENGHGVTQDETKAYRWYTLAAAEARLALLTKAQPGQAPHQPAESQSCPSKSA